MKKILFILILGVIFLTSCKNATKENSVNNVNVNKAIEILTQPQDTIIIAQFNDRYYEIDNNQIKAEYVLQGPNNSNIKIGKVMLAILISFLIGIFWTWIIMSD